MSDPITEANRLVDQLEQEIEELRRLEYRASQLEVAYRVARADAFDAASGSVAAREKQVDRATAEASQARYDAAADVRVQNERLRWLRQKIDVKRGEIATERHLSGVGT